MRPLTLQEAQKISGAAARLTSRDGHMIVSVTDDSAFSINGLTFYSDHVCNDEMCFMVEDGYTYFKDDEAFFSAEATTDGFVYVFV